MGWTASVQVSERTLWDGQQVYKSQRGHCGMDSQRTRLGEDNVGWTASVQVSERTSWYGQPVYSLGTDTATSVLTSAFKVKLAYTQLVLLGRMLPIK